MRSKAKEWNINPDRVGMMGFSAGGEVVALVCRKAEKGKEDATDPIDRLSPAPTSRRSSTPVRRASGGQTLTKEMPPTFIVVGDDDNAATWLVEHYQALKRAGVSAELHVYAKTPHAFGFRQNKTSRPVDAWPQRFEEFLAAPGDDEEGLTTLHVLSAPHFDVITAVSASVGLTHHLTRLLRQETIPCLKFLTQDGQDRARSQLRSF